MLICNKPKIFDIDLYGLAALLCISGLIWLFLIRPLDHEVIQLQKERQQKQQEKESIEAELVQLQNAVQSRRTLTARIRQNADMLSHNIDIPEVIRRLGSLAQNCSIRLDEIAPGDTDSSEQYHKTSMSLKIYGTFPNLRSFLTSIADELLFVRISSLTLTGKQSDEHSCNIAMNMDVFAAK